MSEDNFIEWYYEELRRIHDKQINSFVDNWIDNIPKYNPPTKFDGFAGLLKTDDVQDYEDEILP